jgi:hypothetical protein
MTKQIQMSKSKCQIKSKCQFNAKSVKTKHEQEEIFKLHLFCAKEWRRILESIHGLLPIGSCTLLFFPDWL